MAGHAPALGVDGCSRRWRSSSPIVHPAGESTSLANAAARHPHLRRFRRPQPAATRSPAVVCARGRWSASPTDTSPSCTAAPPTGLRPTRSLAAGAQVLSVETDVPVGTMATAGENDPMRSQQWALNQTSFEQAWSATRGAGVTVAVIDTGVDAAHQDLGSVVLPGIDYIEPTRDGRYDPDGHGTHVAGIIAARVNNGRGIAGAAPGVHILPVRVLDARRQWRRRRTSRPASSGRPITARASST